jgi:hypothetical protein
VCVAWMRFAERTQVDADKLAAAITVLEAGAELDDDQAGLLSEVVGKLRKQPEPTATPSRIGLMQKQLDLLKTIA